MEEKKDTTPNKEEGENKICKRCKIGYSHLVFLNKDGLCFRCETELTKKEYDATHPFPTEEKKGEATGESWEKEFDEHFTYMGRNQVDQLERLLNHFASPERIKAFIESLLSTTEQAEISENTSDGYHTFKELYEFRKLYNAALFNGWAEQRLFDVHKSKRHHDGEECFGGGWFIVMATLPTGQISNHYELKDWDLFQCDERERANEWDGHTTQDVAKRLTEFLSPQEHTKE